MRAAQQSVRDAERRFPVRIRIGIPPEGLGGRLDKWLDANCGSDAWISMPSSTRGVVNDALASYFADVTPRQRICSPVVRLAEGRNSRWGVSGPTRRTDTTGGSGTGQDALIGSVFIESAR
jgi:hypothetical protein